MGTAFDQAQQAGQPTAGQPEVVDADLGQYAQDGREVGQVAGIDVQLGVPARQLMYPAGESVTPTKPGPKRASASSR